MENNNEIIDFFDILSDRVYKENNLSDITWALCEVNKEFKHFFLSFCFKMETSEMKSFDREVPSNDSRPDFYCKDVENKEWIIEVKIDDRKNLHFEQYRKEFPDANIAFIANYDITSSCNQKLNIYLNTWKEFIDCLKEKTDNNLILGYIKYLKNLIGYLEVKDMNLNKIISLPDFHLVLENIIHEYTEKKLEFYNNPKSMFSEKSGRYVYFKNNNNKNIYFWIGIYFCDEEDKIPYLRIEFNVGDKNSVPKNEVSVIKSLKQNEYFDGYINEYEAVFWITNKYHKILFSEEPNIEEQKDVIKNFLNKIIGNL